jgi:3-oxoacyl-(acyl-carrier-protein) synthase
MSCSVVITGLGTVDASGCGRDSIAEALRTSTPRLTEVERPAGYHRHERSHQAALVDAGKLRQWLSPVAARRMSAPSRFAVAAAKIALEDASLSPEDSATAVVLATTYGAAAVTEKLLIQALMEGPEMVSPALFTESVANAPAAQVALACKAQGANITIVQREAGALIAVARGAAEIAAGRARRALAGTVQEVNPLLHSILDRMRVLAPPQADGSEVARPFDRRRNGTIIGEGGTVLVLEEEAAARRRGARVLARITFSTNAFDPEAPRSGWSTECRPLASALRSQLDRAGITPAGIDRIVSWASGTRRGDRLEAGVLRALWDEQPLPPILAAKGVTGDHGGGLLSAAVLAAEGAPFGATAGFAEPDPELGVVPHDGRALEPPHRILVSALAVGGAAAWMVLETGDR